MSTLSSILIANRGEIARRIIRSCKRLGKKTIALYSEADKDALHVQEADEAYFVGPADANLSYLNIPKIIEIAKQSKAEAVHPGYGFLSENKVFAKELENAGICFIGPSPHTLEMLGEKDKARELAAELGIPLAKGVVLVELSEEYLKTQVESLSFPLLIKAVSGGGGRGMRVVSDFAELLHSAPAASREAEQFFGSGSLILEEFISPARHIEIQLLADKHGRAVHLFERDCSAQRRNQKVIEESPARNLPPALLQNLYRHAVELAHKGKLHGVATAEFLVRLDKNGSPDGTYVFLEVNPRIQVEHPVTEMITGIDLVEQQIRVAEGEGLSLTQDEIRRVGHAIQARVYAEIPEMDFLPSAGRIIGLQLPQEEACLLRVEQGLQDAGEVQTHYDSMLIKEIAWGKDFTSAGKRLRQALDLTETPGVANNIQFLSDLLQSSAFVQATLDVAYIGKNPPAKVSGDQASRALLLALAQEFLQQRSEVADHGFFRTGLGGHGTKTLLALPFRIWKVESSNSDESFFFDIRLAERDFHEGKKSLTFEFRKETGERYSQIFHDEELCGVPRRERRPLEAETRSVQLFHQHWTLTPLPLNAHGRQIKEIDSGGEVISPLPGTLVQVLIQEGELVEKGQSLFILDSMKTEHQILSPHKGKIEDIRFDRGSRVLARALLCRIV